MRALILVECLVVIALAALILLHPATGPGGGTPDTFPAFRMLGDAVPGEAVTYRVDEGAGSLEFRVVAVDRGGPQGPPRASIERTFRDATGAVLPEVEPTYVHLLTKHGFLPFMTPEQPAAWDRVWVVKRIRRDTIPWQGRSLRCWHVECIDPGLPADRDAVEVWMHEDVPVYGIFRWQRAGHTYDCTSWRPKT